MQRFLAILLLLITAGSSPAANYMIQQSTTAYPLVFFMADSSDHITGKTGLTCTVTLSKAGGSFGSPSGAVSEIGSGWYKVAGNATDSGTLGPLLLHATASGADPSDASYEVVAFNPQDSVRFGLTALPNANAEASGGLYTRGTGAGQIKQTNNGEIDSNSTHVNNVATTSVTAVNANLGTTQPINFTGTGASALAKSDTVDWAGTALAAPDTAGYPKVTVKVGTGQGEISINGGFVNADVEQINGDTSGIANFANMFNGTGYIGGTNKFQVDVRSWRGTAVPAANVAGVPIVDLKYGLGTAFTEGGSGRFAGALSTFTNVASPVLTAASVNQTADNNTILASATYGNSALLDQLKLRVPAKTWFIQSTGNDSNAGTRDAPFLTTTQLDSVLRHGDTVYLIGTNAITSTWTPGKAITLTGDKGAILRCTTDNTTLQITQSGTKIVGPITINNNASAGLTRSAVSLVSANNVTIDGCSLTNPSGAAGLTITTSTGVVLRGVTASGGSAGCRNLGSQILSTQCTFTGGDHGGYCDAATVADLGYGDCYWYSTFDHFVGTTSGASPYTTWTDPHCAAFFYESHALGGASHLTFLSPVFEATTTNASFSGTVAGVMGEQSVPMLSTGYPTITAGRTIVTNANTGGTTYSLRSNSLSSIVAFDHIHDSTKDNGSVQLQRGIDWAQVANKTTSNNFSGTTIGTATALTTNNDKTGYGLSSSERNSTADAWIARSLGSPSSGTLGKALADSSSAGNPWSALTASNNDAGSFGALFNTNVDAKISEAGGGDGFTDDERAQILAALSVGEDIGVPKNLTWTIARKDGDMKATATIAKDKDEGVDVAADFRSILGASDAISSVTSVELVTTGAGLIEADAFDDVSEATLWMNSAVRFHITGGTTATTYTVRVKVLTVGGQTYAATMQMKVTGN